MEPHEPGGGRVVIGPAMRVDLILDAIGEPGSRHAVRDTFYGGLEYDLTTIDYEPRSLPAGLAGAPFPHLPPNTMPEPDAITAQRHVVTFAGGMNGGMMGAMVDGNPANMTQMLGQGLAWAVNGVASKEHTMAPIFTLERGRSYVLELRNETDWYHPIHLHGHTFRVIGRNGEPAARRPWQDTVLIPPHETAAIAFVADNPGDWMIHCHILEHQAGDMMAVVRVT